MQLAFGVNWGDLIWNGRSSIPQMGIVRKRSSQFAMKYERVGHNLKVMQSLAAESPTRDTSDFAGLLAALTTPVRKREPVWNDEDPGEDVASLSYESALRAHARYRSADRIDGALTQFAGSGLAAKKTAPAVGKTLKATEQSQGNGLTLARVQAEKERKTASITIRLSEAECEQLHRRAAEAGITISAYLRSCTLEAESLRAQVKEALAQFRNPDPIGLEHAEAGRVSWVHRLFRR